MSVCESERKENYRRKIGGVIWCTEKERYTGRGGSRREAKLAASFCLIACWGLHHRSPTHTLTNDRWPSFPPTFLFPNSTHSASWWPSFSLRALCRPKPLEWTLNIWSAQHQASIILQFLMAQAGRQEWRTDKKLNLMISVHFLHVADRMRIMEERMMGGIAVNVAKRAEWDDIFTTSSDLCR